ncbi:hypothetical protein DEO72_LG4g55 [Vigna unguiculata]|uniref:Uncharacterized protein n=1 Tax=Vigna unguiculata TaxID=3917 RepID=A0A4D6LKL7_VIGUN|nr:hypothetical protein DEO72_LG4g55 [Vigna unguiculata]
MQVQALVARGGGCAASAAVAFCSDLAQAWRFEDGGGAARGGDARRGVAAVMEVAGEKMVLRKLAVARGAATERMVVVVAAMVVREEEDGGAVAAGWRWFAQIPAKCRDGGGVLAVVRRGWRRRLPWRVEGKEKIRVRVLGDEGDDMAESDWLIW